MKIEGETKFNAPPQAVWDALLDPDVMVRCVPGCRELKEVEPDQFAALLKIGVGAVSGTYQGTLRIVDKAPGSRYGVAFDGNGAQGFVKGSGTAHLVSNGDGTILTYVCVVEVGGLIASVGQRVLEGVGKFLVKQMFNKVRAHVG